MTDIFSIVYIRDSTVMDFVAREVFFKPMFTGLGSCCLSLIFINLNSLSIPSPDAGAGR